MPRISVNRPGPARRRGKVLALFVLLLPVLVGVVGLVVDTGILLAAHRQAQNAADAACLAAAQSLLTGNSNPTTAAATFVHQHNGLAQATVAANNPPSQGAYAGDANYVEVVVSAPTGVWFIQVLGVGATQTVAARAVAGLESVPATQAIACLRGSAAPGLALDGVAVQVAGTVSVNAEGSGSDAQGGWVDWGAPSFALTTANGATLTADRLQVVGGVNAPGSLPSSLEAGVLPFADPLWNLPTPMCRSGVNASFPGANGQTFTTPQNVALTINASQSVTLAPGVYASIAIDGPGPGTVTFQPGIYVLSGGNAGGQALSIATGAAVTASGVLFYNTGSDFDPATGLPDSGDTGSGASGAATGTSFGRIAISAGQLTLTPLAGTDGPFDGLTFFQRRASSATVGLTGNNSKDVVSGTLYASGAACSLAGPGSFTGQFLAGSLRITGTSMSVAPSGSLAKAPRVFLVE